MKEELKKDIFEVYELLCDRDPEWRHPKMLPKFETLYEGWRTVELRHNVHARPFYSHSWQRKWLPKNDFERFKNYAMQ